MCLLALLTACAAESRQPSIRVQPAPLSEGPVLFFIEPDESTGTRLEALHVLDPAFEAGPSRVLAMNSNLRVLARVDRVRFVLQTYQEPRGLWILDLERGAMLPISTGTGEYEFFGINKGLILFRMTARFGPLGYQLEASGEDLRVVQGLGVPGYLMTARAEDSWSAVRLSDVPVTGVLEIEDDVIWAAGGQDRLGLWVFTFGDGKSRRVCDLPEDVIPDLLTTFALSPNRTRLALGLARARSWRTRDLRVIEVDTGSVIRNVERIPVQVSTLSSSAPRLEIAWRDEKTVRFSETEQPPDSEVDEGWFRWVDVNVESGKRLREERYVPMSLSHSPPLPSGAPVEPPGPRWQQGCFQREGRKLFLGKSAEPLGETGESNEIDISDDGEWAALRLNLGDHSTRHYSLVVVDGRKGTRWSWDRPWGYDYRWMPRLR